MKRKIKIFLLLIFILSFLIPSRAIKNSNRRESKYQDLVRNEK